MNKYSSRIRGKAIAFCLLLGFALSSCEGGGVFGGGDGDSCRVKDDCDSDFYCRGPNQPTVCGVPPRDFCASDPDCPMGTVCHAIFDGCSTDAIGSECNQPCTANNCNTGFRCNAGGACEPIPCDEGFTCPSWQKCDPTIAHDLSVPVHARATGCVNMTCTDDKACPSGKLCVTGYCQEGLGVCREDIAVP